MMNPNTNESTTDLLMAPGDIDVNDQHQTADLPMPDRAGDFGTNVGAAISEKVDVSDQRNEFPPSRCNVGRAEQKFRLGAGAVLLAAAAFAPLSRGWRIGLAALGAAELTTGAMRYCPVSQLLGINTCRGDEA
jgi:hypothetical protein